MNVASTFRHFVHHNLAPLLMTSILVVNFNTAVASDVDHTGHHHQHHNAAPQTAATASVDHHTHHQQITDQPGYKKTQEKYELPSLELITMQGETVSLSKLLDVDQPIAVNFIFTSCTTICPLMSATFSHAQKKLGSEAGQIRWVSISIDPEYDTPERLRDYAKRFDAGSQWYFLTGSIENVVAIQKAFDAYRGDKMNHTPATFLRAGRNAPWVRLVGLSSGNELVNEYRQMMAGN